MGKIIFAVLALTVLTTSANARDRSCGNVPCSRINAYVQQCWVPDDPDYTKLEVSLSVMTDVHGTVQDVRIAMEDHDRVKADPILREFAKRAIETTLDPDCARLPFPPSMLGVSELITFRFHVTNQRKPARLSPITSGNSFQNMVEKYRNRG